VASIFCRVGVGSIAGIETSFSGVCCGAPSDISIDPGISFTCRMGAGERGEKKIARWILPETRAPMMNPFISLSNGSPEQAC